MILTLETLKAKRACDDQLALFRKMFGASVDVTPELCESVADKFDSDWAARHLLSPSARAELPARHGARTGRVPAQYERAKARAFGELFCDERSHAYVSTSGAADVPAS